MAVKYNENGKDFYCMGIIVSKYKILTMASCVYKKESVQVEFGLITDYPVKTKKVPSNNIVTHPKYPSNENDYNIAVIEFTSKIDLGSKMSMIEMVDEEHTLLSRTYVSMLGYRFKDSVRKLISIDSTIMNFELCKTEYRNKKKISLINGLEFCVDMRDSLSPNTRLWGG